MGGFFLYQTQSDVDTNAVKEVFKRKGFYSVEETVLGEWSLITCPKIAAKKTRKFSDPNGNIVYGFGTFIYKGLNDQDSLREVLQEFQENRIDSRNYVGNYCLLFWDGNELSFFLDPQYSYHIFQYSGTDSISSSFLALMVSDAKKKTINKFALLEKLATGCIVSPDTFVREIQQLHHSNEKNFSHKTGVKIIGESPPELPIDLHAEGRIKSVHKQVSCLKNYFEAIDCFQTEQGCELGLSSGFDSRLLLTLSGNLSNSPIAVHTHRSGATHEKEVEVVKLLARLDDNPLTIKKTRCMEELSEEEYRKTIIDNLYFFDGRTCHDMGAYSETYTADYRRSVIGINRLSLNGLGGEIYRNYYGLPSSGISWADWQLSMQFFPFAYCLSNSNSEFNDLVTFINNKIASRLKTNLNNSVCFNTIRAYYSLIQMPDCASNVLNAYNQVSFILTPFIERDTVQEALKAVKYIGSGGEYQALMISALSTKHAEINSHYGYPFIKIPFKVRARNWVKKMTPLKLRLNRVRSIVSDPNKNVDFLRYMEFRKKSPYLQDVTNFLMEFLPGCDWEMVMKHYAQRWNAIAVGSFFLEFKDKLKW